MKKWTIALAVAGLAFSARPATAQNADELAKQTQNPVASLISVPLQGNWDFGIGDRDAVGTTLNIQPVMPFGVSKSTNVILRVIMPLTTQPAPDGTRLSGFGDVLATAFFSPQKSGTIIWGVGPAFLLPSGTNTSLSAEKFAVGPSVVALTQPGKWTLGVLFNHLWSVSGANDRADVNSTYETWTAPLLFNVSKVTLLGKRPVSFSVAAGPTLANPDGGASWKFRLAATFLFPR